MRVDVGCFVAALVTVVIAACGGQEEADVEGGRRASYLYVARDFDRMIGADVTLRDGAIVDVQPYDFALPSGMEVMSLHFAGPGAGAMMVRNPSTDEHEVYQWSPSGSWDLVEGHPDGSHGLGCAGFRRMRAVSQDVIVLVHVAVDYGWACAGPFERSWHFFSVSRYERGVGWSVYRPEDFDAATEEVNEVLPGEYEYSDGVLIDYDDEQRTLTYLLYSPNVPFSIIRADIDSWEFELGGTQQCTPDFIQTLGDGRYAMECLALRHHCDGTECEQIEVEEGVVSYGTPERYDRQEGALVGMSTWLENFVLHTRSSLPGTISSCEPVMFSDPADPARVRIVTDSGEMLYDTRTGSMSEAAEPLRDRIFGSDCYSVLPTPFFFAE